MLAGIRDILIISTPRDLPVFEELFGTGAAGASDELCRAGISEEDLRMRLSSGKSLSAMITWRFVLGDNIFYGQSFQKVLKSAAGRRRRATIFRILCVRDPRSTVSSSSTGTEKRCPSKEPERPKVQYAVPGLYFCDNDVVESCEKRKAVRPRRD